MTTSAQVRTAFKENVFDHATIQAITTNAFAYDVLANVASISEDSLLYFNQQINFFTYQVSRIRENGEIRSGGGNATRYRFRVSVNYYIEKDISDTNQNYNTAIDNLEAMDSLVSSALGKNWDSTVDYSTVTGIRTPELILLDEREIWRVGYDYEAIKQV